MNGMVRVKRNCKTLNVSSCACFNLCILFKVKEIIKRFFRNDLTSFYVTSYIWFAASLIANCDVSRLELVKNMIQIIMGAILL